MRFLRPTAGWAAGLAVALLACSPDQVGGPSLMTPAPSADVAPAAASVPLLVITEIMPNPAGTDTEREFIEVYNAGNSAVNLNGYRFLSGVTATPESFTVSGDLNVAPGGFLIFAASGGTDETHGGLPFVSYEYPVAFILNNSNTDWVALKTADGQLVDSIAYSTRNASGAIVAPTYTPTSDVSKAVIDPCADNTIVGGTNWANAAAAPGGTYGLGGRGTPGASHTGTTYVRCEVGEVGPVADVVISPPNASIVIGRTRAFGAQGFDASGNPSPTSFAFASTDASIVSVDPASGVATGVAEGAATIIATAENGVADTAEVTVTATPDVASITLSEDAVTIQGYTHPIFFTVRDGDNQTITPPPPLVWSSSDEMRAGVDQRGYVYARNPGAVTIRATAPNGVFGQITLTVLDTLPPPASLIYRDHLEFGTPTDGTPGDELVLMKRQFVSSWNGARGQPNWVSWNINATNFGGSGRCECFTSDPTVPEPPTPPVHDSDYRGSGYDRGHMVQSDSRSRNFTENASTFLLSNIVPQGSENNQGPWLAFEQFLNAQAESFGKDVYVVAGGIYAPVPTTLKDEGRVAIPDYTWKVAIVVPAGTQLEDIDDASDLQMFAVKMPNLETTGGPASSVGIRTNPWQMYETSVDAIEAAAGYDVFAALPAPIEAIAESRDRFPVAHAGGPYTGTEGRMISFSAAGSSDPDGDALTYAWDLDDDGAFDDATGVSASRTFADNGTYTVRVQATDPKGAASVASATATIGNDAPVIRQILFNFPTLNRPRAGSTFHVSFRFSDAGVNDAAWTWTLHWGDGTSSTGSVASQSAAVSASHVYAAPGSRTARLILRDKDGGVVEKSFPVEVQP